MSGQFQSISRVERPRDQEFSGPEIWELTGGQHEWNWAIGLPYRSLAAPWTGAVMPAAPGVGDDMFDYLGYWACLQSFLLFSFGWTRHDRGLMWWYDAGKPTDDPRLELIARTWERDGMLARYLDWWMDRERWPLSGPPVEEWQPLLGEWLLRPYDSTSITLDREWEARLSEARRHGSLDGSACNPAGMHMDEGWHVGSPARGREKGSKFDAHLFAVDANKRTATYVSNIVVGWYRGLAELASELPPVQEDRSWHIDVYVKPIGFMGTYRRSRETGLWFSGQHKYHAVGN